MSANANPPLLDQASVLKLQRWLGGSPARGQIIQQLVETLLDKPQQSSASNGA